MNDARGIALLGFMGSGKTTVGRAIASRLGWRHVDLDDEVARRWGPIPAQITRDGEPAFRERERTALAEIPSRDTVLSLGGGSTLDARSRGLVESRFQTVWLDADLPTLRARVGAGVGRPLWADAERLFDARLDVYGSARARVDGRQPVDVVVDAVLSAIAAPRVERVQLGPRSYEVVIAPGFDGLAERLPPEVRVITESRVASYWADALARETGRGPDVVLPPGEREKTLPTWARAVDGLLASGVRRSTTVVALGGGVLGDIAGFAAASTLRGLAWVQVPTTLLAMVDASVGGKTGVNHPSGKNLIGAFHQPSCVWMPLRALSTLPARERVAGLAEVMKIALLRDPALWEVLEAHGPALRDGDPGLTEHVIARSVRAKAALVAEDELDRGARELLNAGHTLGHALEQTLGYGVLLHGEAVSIGLVAETRWAEAQGHAEAGLSDRVARVASALGLPVAPPPGLSGGALRRALDVDKKTTCDTLWVPISARVGLGGRVAAAGDTLGSLVRLVETEPE